MKQIRTALAVALLLNRTLVRPTKPLRSMFLCFVVVFTMIDFMHECTQKSYVLYNDYLIVSLCIHIFYVFAISRHICKEEGTINAMLLLMLIWKIWTWTNPGFKIQCGIYLSKKKFSVVYIYLILITIYIFFYHHHIINYNFDSQSYYKCFS